jgi:hypothetical protein
LVEGEAMARNRCDWGYIFDEQEVMKDEDGATG